MFYFVCETMSNTCMCGKTDCGEQPGEHMAHDLGQIVPIVTIPVKIQL